MAITLSPTLETEMDSLFRHPASEMTVERFLPEWTQQVAHGAVDYAHGHAAVVAPDGNGAGEDILFRARISGGELQYAIIKDTDLDDPTTWETLWTNSGITGFVDPAWSANAGATYGGSVCCAASIPGEFFRCFAIKTDGAIIAYDFDYDGVPLGNATVVTITVDEAMQIGCCKVDEMFLVRHELVESGQAAWHQAVYGTNIYRYVESGGWSVDSNPFLFHTHSEAHLVKDGPLLNAGSANIEAQWGFRPCGGLGVSNLNTNTALITIGMRYYYRKSYNVHTQAVMGFHYHRDNGLWERAFDNDDADYDSENQLWLDVFARASEIEGRHFITWVRLNEPSEFEQIADAETLPRVLETVYAKSSTSGYDLTQFQYLGPPDELSSTHLVVINRNSLKALYSLGYTAVYSSPPAAFLCEVPDTYKIDMALYANSYSVVRDNRWQMVVKTTLEDASVRFNSFLQEGNLVRVFHGIEGELMQIGQGHIDTTQPALNLRARQHKGPLMGRAELKMLHTKAETIEDIFPMATLTIVPEHPGGRGSNIVTSEGEEFSVHHPIGINYHRGWWLLKKMNWPGLYFAGTYPGLAGKLCYRMEAFPWAFTGGGPADLPPGVYGGPGDVADPRKEYKRGTYFNDIVWVNIEPRIDGAIQSSVRFGDDRGYGSFGFIALDGCDVSAVPQLSNGLITGHLWYSGECWDDSAWNDVRQESVMAGLICRAVQGEYSDDIAGKKYAFVWEANSDFSTGSHLEDQAGRFWGSLVFDKPDYGAFPVGQNKFYLYISDFDDADEGWQGAGKWVHKAVAHADATGLTTGHPADLKMQVLGGTIYCFYRPYNTGTNPKNLWRHAITYKAGHFGAGRFGLVARGHSGIQWDTLWKGRNQIDQTDNVVDFWDIEATDSVKDLTLEDIIEHYAWKGLTTTEFRSDVNLPGPIAVNAGALDNSINRPVENLCVDFTVTISADGGEAGLFLRAVDNDVPLGDCALLGIVAHSTYKQGDSTLNCYAVLRRYESSVEVLALREYSPSPLHLKPNLPYQVRISVRNDLFSIWIEGNHIGHFHLTEELGLYWGLYAIGQNASFSNIHLPELHEVPENALLDPNQTMFDAIKRTVGYRHIKGVWRPYGNLLVSYFDDHDTGPVFDNNLKQSAYQQSERFYSTVEMQGASNRATYSSLQLLEKGRHYGLFNNPDIMTIEKCYYEARRIVRETGELMKQPTFVGLPDLRLEPEDEIPVVVTPQNINGNYLVESVEFAFTTQKGKEDSSLVIPCRQVFIL